MRSGSQQAGPHGAKAGGAAGFTILELMVVLALVVLITASVAGVSVALLRDKPVTGEEALRAAISKARKQAVLESTEVHLAYDKKARCFVISTVVAERRLINEMKGPLDIDFLPPVRSSAVLLGGDVVEGDALRFVSFYPDGACSPFRAQIKTGGAARTLTIDPWTCAEVTEDKTRR